MIAVADRPLRADAARNAERILHAAREIYAELGADAAIEAIARRAGVGERTLYRRFPTKAELVRAALDQSITEDLMPAIEEALRADNPLTGLVQLFEAAISLAAREHHLLTAARKAGSLTWEVSTALNEALDELFRRAQEAGVVRADLVADDLPRVIAMLHSVLFTMEPTGDGWRRYLGLILDAISTGERRTLPAAAPLRMASPSNTWM